MYYLYILTAHHFFRLYNVLFFSTAGYCSERQFTIRLVVGTWCLAIFVLSNYYCTLLISYVTARNPQPLIRSVQELETRHDIRIVTDKLRNAEDLMLVYYLEHMDY